MFALVLLVGVFGYFFVRELSSQYRIQGQITALEQQILDLENENNDMDGLIAYFGTESFQEKEIRSKLNLQKPGEHVVALPVDLNSEPLVEGSFGGEEDETKKNWSRWWEYFFSE